MSGIPTGQLLIVDPYTAPMSSIALSGVSKSWAGSTALQGIDLAIAAGSFCVLLGPSGCGIPAP
jgi:ABC-type transporter Mla maintaining outer membrane lipid asymmetry ATPase subunit MlaF